jgi:phosphoenolpyruvate carboxykinase (GTP)
MELRVHNDVGARVTPTGLIPKYEDLHLLFKQVLNKEYSKEEYTKQFTIRVPENLAKIERAERFYKEKVADAPEELFIILGQQRGRLLKAREKFGANYVPPEWFDEE